MIKRIRNAFVEAFDCDPETITEETVPDEVDGWDSMGHFNLVSVLSDEFDITIDVTETVKMRSVADIIKVLTDKGLE